MKEKLEGYLATLSVGDETKRKIRKDVQEFVAVLKELGQDWPEEGAYEVYRERLESAKKTEGTIRDSLNRVKKFFASVSKDNDSAEKEFEAPDLETKSVDVKTNRRFSLLIPPALNEALELLAQYDNCSVAKIIVHACEKYILDRADDCEYLREQKRKLEERKARKCSYHGTEN